MPTIVAHPHATRAESSGKMLCHQIASEIGTNVVPAVRIGPLQFLLVIPFTSCDDTVRRQSHFAEKAT